MGKRLGILLGAFAFLGVIAADAQAVDYQMVDLGTLGERWSVARGINDSGQIVGYTASRAFLWQNGKMQDLGMLVGSSSAAAYSINNSGQVVGAFTLTNGKNHAFFWQNGVMQDLGTFGGSLSAANNINNSGQVVGKYRNAYGKDHAFIWQNGVMQDLGTFPGDASSYAADINDSGQIVGGSCSGAHALLWQNGVMQDLGKLPSGQERETCGINNYGQVVGWCFVQFGYSYSRAFLWQNGVMQDLGLLNGYYSSSYAYGINDSGQIVGKYGYHAFLWQNGMMQDLGTLGGSESGAYSINNKGQVAGWAEGTDGQSHAVLWDPIIIPEPSGLLALASGLGAFGVLLRRRK